MKLKNIMNSRIKMYFVIAILAIGILQCKKDEVEPSAPTITITNPTDANPVAYPGKNVQLSLVANADSENGASLSSIVVKSKFEDADAWLPVDDPLSGSTYTLDKSIQVADDEGTEVWTITVTDDQGKQTVRTITISIEGDAPDLAPAVVFAGGTQVGTNLPYRNVNFSIDINTKFAIGILAQSNVDSQAELSRFVFKKAAGATNPETIFDTLISGPQFTWDVNYFSNYQPAVETYYFKITDVNGEVTEKNIIVTTLQADMGIFIFEGKHVGSYESGVNSGFNTRTEEGYTYDVHTLPVEDEAQVDFIFFQNESFGFSLMSPENQLLIGMYPSINDWETRNRTMFQKTTFDNPAEDYDYISNKNQLILAMQNLAGIGPFTINYYSEFISQPGGFEVNDIFAFENPDGNRGLMVIREIDEGATPGETTIIFDMKVEKP